jgi:flagellar basal body P-ring protein FlgI
MAPRSSRRAVAPLLLCVGLAALPACSRPKKVKEVDPPAAMLRDVPSILQGTVGAEASFRGVEPVLVSGLGIVVGLAGTGGADNLDPGIAATMEREIARGGIGRGAVGENYPQFRGMSASEFLRSKDVAVVLVEARIAPGAPKGAPFDVYVRTLPGSSVTSLEGGTLWTTELRIGPASVMGAVKTRKLAEATGPIFINPFAEPSVGPTGELQVTRTAGRVLGGGTVTDPLQIEMVLDNESHARARSVVATINTRFPREPGDDGPTARGRGVGGGGNRLAGEGAGQSIALRVPRSFRDRSGDFLQLVRHLRVDQTMPEEWARAYTQQLKDNPALAEDLSWCLQALGRPAVPFLHPMYDYPELAPRMAALRAGARLGDARAARPLIDMARAPGGGGGLRTEAIRLLGDMPPDPSINLALRELLGAKDLEVRVAAYESLREQRDPLLVQVPIGEPRQPKFLMELIPAPDPMVYVTQQGQPRIVIFGGVDPSGKRGARGNRYRGVPLNVPALVTAWDQRFMVRADPPAGSDIRPTVRVFYRDPRTLASTTTNAPADLAEFVEYLARTPTPEDPAPGLGLSYSEVVGALYEMSRQGGYGAAFATEEDRLKAEIYEASQTTALTDRPETPADQTAAVDAMFKPQPARPVPGEATAGATGGAKGSRIIKLTQPTAPKQKPAGE